MNFPADPPWPLVTVAGVLSILAILGHGSMVFLGMAWRIPALRRVVIDEGIDENRARLFSAGLGWMMAVVCFAFVLVAQASDHLRSAAAEGYDVWWAAGSPADFPVPPEQGIGVLGWLGLAAVMAAVVWGLVYVLHGFQRFGAGRRAVKVGVLRLGGVTAVLGGYAGLLWFEVWRQQQAWAEWIEVFSA